MASAASILNKINEQKKNLEKLEKKLPSEQKKKETNNKKNEKPKISSYERKKRFSGFIKKAGIEAGFDEVNNLIIYIVASLILLGTIALTVDFVLTKTFWQDTVLVYLSLWTLGTTISYLLLWAAFFFYVDIRAYQLMKEVEAVFPDFLELTAANISSGMPIDRALWYAIRPRFGQLAKDMESVAKATMVGESLPKALTAFSNKYDSVVIKRSMNLLLEGLESGGEVGDLLTRVAVNIRDTEIMKKEMASNVTTYVIFILFATLGAAPFLFGLTTELIVIMKSIIGNIDMPSDSSSMGGIGMTFSASADSISVGDYQVFAIMSVCISSIFAAIIISVIQKGSAREAYRNIPLYIAIGLINYFLSFTFMNMILGSMFI
ncbi:MAG: type II secretion system F family protein [Nanoarchaeota archaeon]|nr:type II secretion system F family protein [Nanoarchaeota archaeon]